MPEPPINSLNKLVTYPLAKTIVDCNIQPITITLVNIIVSLTIIILLAYDSSQNWLIVVLLFARFFLDCLDGATARKCNNGSDLGAKLDKLADFCFVIAAVLAISHRNDWQLTTTLLVLCGYMLCSWTKPVYKFIDYNSIIIRPMFYIIAAKLIC